MGFNSGFKGLSSFFQGKWLVREDDKQHLTSGEVKKAL